MVCILLSVFIPGKECPNEGESRGEGGREGGRERRGGGVGQAKGLGRYVTPFEGRIEGDMCISVV